MLKVKIIAHTPEPEKVVASAAKLCYSPVGVDEIQENMTQEQIDKFVNKLASMGHESPVEHVTFTFAIEGISRVTTHQLVRHRIASYSQQSQRYVKLEQFEYIVPPEIEKIPAAKKVFIEAMERDQKAYDGLVNILMEEKWRQYEHLKLTEKERKKILNKIEKEAIEDARYVFPNACETKIVATMNVRTLLHFFNVRCCERAQWEIRDMAAEMLKECKKVAPALFKNAGPSCVRGKCPEGAMCCGNPKKASDFE